MADTEPKLLWRYMPLAGLINLLQTKSLHFARATVFEDTREGELALNALVESVGAPRSARLGHAFMRLKSECYISCWHLADTESFGMWKQYGSGMSSAAIVSGVGPVMSIGDAFCADLRHLGMFGQVLYDKDLVVAGKERTETIGLPFGYRELPIPLSVKMFFYKGPAFESDKEWRLVLWRRSSEAPFLRVPIPDMASFLSKIVVAPDAPDWVLATVENLVHNQFELPDVAVQRSGQSSHVRR